MKIWHLSFLFALLLSTPIVAQHTEKPGLVLEGTVIEIGVSRDINLKNGKPLFFAAAYMQVRNDGDRPIILIDPRAIPTGPVIEFSNVRISNGRSDTEAVTAEGLMLGRPDIQVPLLFKKLEIPDPRERPNLIKILEPGAYFEFRDMFLIEEGYEVYLRPGVPIRKQDPEELNPKPKFPFFRVKYRLSPKKYSVGDDTLSKLQTRWSTYGNFLIDENGDFSLTSEFIQNKTLK